MYGDVADDISADLYIYIYIYMPIVETAKARKQSMLHAGYRFNVLEHGLTGTWPKNRINEPSTRH